MKSLFFLFFGSIIISSTCLGKAYICNLDYHEDIRKHVSIGSTAILLSDDCVVGKKISYEETLGEFKIQITYQDEIKINITQGLQVKSDIIKRQDFRKRFLKSYVSGRSGLRIACEERSIGITVIESPKENS